MATVHCNMQFVGNTFKVQRTGELCSQQVQEKLISALQLAAQASVYATQSAVIDLSVSQSILLTIMYGLMKGDTGFCNALIEVSESLVQLKSSYLKVWLRDDFNFQKNDIVEMFSKLSQMMEVGSLWLPQYISTSFSTLIEKYGLLEHFSISGDLRAGRLVSELNSLNFKGEKPYESEAPLPGSSSTGMVESLESLSEEEIQLRLRKAVQNNNPIAIAALINAGANIDDELDNGDTLLHLAVSNSHVEAVNLLLQSGVIPNWRNKDYITPLQMAVDLNNNVIVESLVRSGAEVNQRSTEGSTLLHQAASIGNTQVLKVLVRLGAAVDTKNDCGQTPLHLATKGNHLEAVEALVEAGAGINILSNDGEAAIHIAVSKGYSKILKSLVRSGADLTVKTKTGLSVLHLAANRHVVKLLTNGGANINILSDAGDTPLHHAAINGCIEVAKALIASNASIECLNKKNASPLSVALKEEHSEMVRLLVASGANVNFKDKEDIENSLLHWAVQEEKLNCVQLLIDSGSDVNIKNLHNNTPLHYAASIGNLTITELLLNKGAIVNINNNKGEGPYHYAALNGHLQVAQLLLNKGAKMSQVKIYVPEETAFATTSFKFGATSVVSDTASHSAARNESCSTSNQSPSKSELNKKAEEKHKTVFTPIFGSAASIFGKVIHESQPTQSQPSQPVQPQFPSTFSHKTTILPQDTSLATSSFKSGATSVVPVIASQSAAQKDSRNLLNQSSSKAEENKKEPQLVFPSSMSSSISTPTLFGQPITQAPSFSFSLNSAGSTQQNTTAGSLRKVEYINPLLRK